MPGEVTPGKIILILIIVAGFVTAIVLLRNTLNKNCSEGEVYDDTLARCIKDCSKERNQHYSSEKDACVTNCLDNEIVCGDGCASNDRNEDCLADDNGTRADDQDRGDVGAFGHQSPFAQMGGRAAGAPCPVYL